MHGNKEMIDIDVHMPLTKDALEFKCISNPTRWYQQNILDSLLDMNEPTRTYNLKGAQKDQWADASYHGPLLAFYSKRSVYIYFNN